MLVFGKVTLKNMKTAIQGTMSSGICGLGSAMALHHRGGGTPGCHVQGPFCRRKKTSATSRRHKGVDADAFLISV